MLYPVPSTAATLQAADAVDRRLRRRRHARRAAAGTRYRLLALTSESERARRRCARPACCRLIGDLDEPATLQRLGRPGRCGAAPCAAGAARQASTRARCTCCTRSPARAACGASSTPARPASTATATASASTRRGARNAQTDRARRRVDAERRLRWYGRAMHARVTLLRIPGIYAPTGRAAIRASALRAGRRCLVPRRRCLHEPHPCRRPGARLRRGAGARLGRSAWCTSATTRDMKMGDYFDLAADLCRLPRPPRISAQQAVEQLSPASLSFMRESRRLVNRRLKRELRLRLRYPTVAEGPRCALDASERLRCLSRAARSSCDRPPAP